MSINRSSDDDIFIGRMTDLARRAARTYTPAHSDFLNLYEQSLVERERLNFDAPYIMHGGAPDCERKIVLFGGDEGELPPVTVVKVEPRGAKFARELSHRDFLGSVLALGVRREKVGDIFLQNNSGYVFCFEQVASLILSSLERVGNVPVKCSLSSADEVDFDSRLEQKRIICASERLDALVGAVFSLSRAQSAKLISSERVFINSRAVSTSAAKVAEGDVVSVRGEGRFIFDGIEGQTRSGRAHAVVRIYR